MSTVINYKDSLIKGHLEVLKVHEDGTEEVHFSEQNVITSGMGHTLLKAFNAQGDESIEDFQIRYFQLGFGGLASRQVSGTGDLGYAFDRSAYSVVNFDLVEHDLSSGTPVSGSVFGVIPIPFITKISDTKVMYQVVLGSEACVGRTINEIGLFSKNPDQAAVNGSYLCAYRYFTALNKTNSISVIFRWTIEF
jgi:hypothetical protein